LHWIKSKIQTKAPFLRYYNIQVSKKMTDYILIEMMIKFKTSYLFTHR